MGLAQVQRLLAELYTDPALRESFIRDRQAVAEAFDLSADEAHQLSQLSTGQVTFFANSLQRKRLNGVAKLLPLTKRALGDRFADLFRQYAVTPLPPGTRKSRADALAFATYVEKIARRDHIEPPWAVDLLRYEAGRLKAADPTSRCTIRRLRRPIATLVRCVEPDPGALRGSPRPTVALWLRLSPGGRLRHFSLPLPCPFGMIAS